MVSRDNFERSGKKLEMSGENFRLGMFGKNSGGQKFQQRGGEDFVKFYLAPPKNTCCPLNAPQILRPGAATVLWFHVTSWISLEVNSKSIHSHRRKIVFYCRCWPCVWQQICAISWDFFSLVHHNNQYILGWPTLRLTAKYPSETQEYSNKICLTQLVKSLCLLGIHLALYGWFL